MDAPPRTLITERLTGVHHRQLLVVTGAEVWCLNQVEQLINAIPDEKKAGISILTCSAELSAGLQQSSTNNSQFRHHLGREYDWVVYNAWRGLRANALAALAGTIKKNGLMILLCPELLQWPELKDEYLPNRISYGSLGRFKRSLFIEHIVTQIQQDNDVIQLSWRGLSGQNRQINDGEYDDAAKHQQQKSIIEQIQKVATGHRKRPLVVTADRGRGKTAALGIAAAELILAHGKKILVTAPQKTTIETLFRHAHASCSHAADYLQFVALDDLILNQPDADLLLVDEAAGIPVHQLQTLTRQYHRIVFTSTIDGYEGSGRGFEIRFKPWLQHHRPGVRFGRLDFPFRWYPDDCLEHFWWRTLHLKKTTLDHKKSRDSATITIQSVARKTLLEQPDLLNATVSLLVDAHYQTTPDDLMALLDAPEQHLFLAFSGSATAANLAGAVTGNIEGGINEKSLANNILSGRRRLQGHMLPQQIAYANADALYLQLSYFRVIRIAVTQSHRRKGIGKHLIGFVAQWCSENRVDSLGSSFGANSELLKFWLKCHCHPALLGFHRDKATAEYNLTVLRPVSDNVHDHIPTIQANMNRLIDFHLPDLYQFLENRLIALLKQNSIRLSDNCPDIEKEKQVIMLFCDGNRSLELSAPWLAQVAHSAIQSGVEHSSELDLLINFALKRMSTTDLIRHHQLDGKKQLIDKLREVVKQLFVPDVS